jgi:hypothetical protein
MKFIDDLLDNIDNYFEGKKESEKTLMIFASAAIVGYLAYLMFLPFCEDRYNATETEKSALQKTIDEQKNYMRSITLNGDKDAIVKKITNDISMKKQEVAQMVEKMKLIDSNMIKLSDMIFNPKSWSLFLNSISTRASAHKVSILKIDNKYVDNNSSDFGHVLKIKVKCEGAYANLMLFMNELEQNRLVTDLYDSKLASGGEQGKIIADLNISVWGVNH